MILCPACKGIGWLFGFFKPVQVICDVCGGSGKIGNKKQLWINQGKLLRNYRLIELKLGLREAARKYNLDPSLISKMERGVVAPKNLYLEKELSNN